MPKLNEARQNASACLLGDTVYIVGGFLEIEESGGFLESIERLNLASRDND